MRRFPQYRLATYFAPSQRPVLAGSLLHSCSFENCRNTTQHLSARRNFLTSHFNEWSSPPRRHNSIRWNGVSAPFSPKMYTAATSVVDLFKLGKVPLELLHVRLDGWVTETHLDVMRKERFLLLLTTETVCRTNHCTSRALLAAKQITKHRKKGRIKTVVANFNKTSCLLG
jgi:hypothetical protein